MSAITRTNSTGRTPDRDTRTEYGRPDHTRPDHGLAEQTAALPTHPSWRFQDHFELWADWLERNSAGQWQPHQSVMQRTFRTREDTLLHAERFITRGDFPMGHGNATPVTLLRNRRESLLAAFREAEGDGVTLIREVIFPVGEYALSLKVTRERVAEPVRTTFGHAANPLRSLAGQPVKLTVLIEHPYDVLERASGHLNLGDRAAQVGAHTQEFAAGTPVTGVPYRHATVSVSRGLLKKPLLYRYEVVEPDPEDPQAPTGP
ncbi:hypothetical protein GCM10008959_08560 [Deinococcus seoulensis]|uniref:Uncharacterized protein n=2 Tax=Deinococcus TaxID=1298 RepID=A0ABQ2RND9_9DEIO|nr:MULTISPECIES: hypothetical protein [Deinococcus]GGR49556.1 hypothetical protein GCM10008959_08560 [Deinococcus seoulensis]GGS18824.1 hypothetical protein GCM10008961_07940 [Deinococcus knuensis]